MGKFLIGQFRERVTVLRLSVSGLDTRWEALRLTWAMAEREKDGNIFSSVGLSAESWVFVVRRQDVSMADAILFQGQHHFITAVSEPERGFLEIRAARVRMAQCCAVGEPEAGAVFPAALTEKYVRFAQQFPMDTVGTLLVLVTPKVVTLNTNDQVDVDGVRYFVQATHTLDVWKNEYEIFRGEES